MNQDSFPMQAPAQAATDTDTAAASEAVARDHSTLHAHQVDAHTIRAREAERAALRADIEAFLNSGGKVTTIAANVRTDNPRKPQNNYGKGSL